MLALMTMDTQLPENAPLVARLKGEANNLGLLEAFLESAPQLILQLSIVLRLGVMSKYKLSRKICAFLKQFFN